MKIEKFKKWVGIHRKHQLEAFEEIYKEDVGQCYLPTGSGKSYIQMRLLIQEMLTNDETPGVYVIAAHRLLLCEQLMKEITEVLFMCEVSFDVLYVSSANESKEQNEFDEYIKSKKGNVRSDLIPNLNVALTKEDIENYYNISQNKKRHLLVVSTYHSLDRIECIPNINIMTCDEAHTTLQKEFSFNIDAIRKNIQKIYFFTATPKHIGDKGGMKNEDVYGKILYQQPHINLINAGEIIAPRFLFLHTEQEQVADEYDNYSMHRKALIEGFKQHQKDVKYGAKMLAACKGTDFIKKILVDKVFINFCNENKIKVFSFASDEDVRCQTNFYERRDKDGVIKLFEFTPFKIKDRKKMLSEIKALQETEKVIFLHIDILSEGIDIPQMTGVILFRDMNTAKLFQTIGRTLRLSDYDRKRLYSGEILPNEIDKFRKPYGYVIVPTFVVKEADINEEITKVIEGTGIPWEEIKKDNVYIGIEEDELPDNVVNKITGNNGKKECGLFATRKDIIKRALSSTKVSIDDIDFSKDTNIEDIEYKPLPPPLPRKKI